MSRVKSVVGKSIMVHIHDVVPGDVLYISGDETDPIIQSIERNGDLTKFHYVPNRGRFPFSGIPRVQESNWMDPNDRQVGNGCCFIHDLRQERFEYLENQNGEDLQDRISG